MSLKPIADEAADWALRDALPLWLEHGLDRKRGGFFEALDPETLENTADFRRLRVVTRQIYVFSAGMRLGHRGARAGLDHGLEFLLNRARHSEGGFVNRFDLDGLVTDETRDLYDLAFVAFALAHAYDVTRDTALKDEAVALGRFINSEMRHPNGGFREALPDRGPRRQNPHMHLLEAALAWTELAPDTPYTEIARDLAALFRGKMFQAESGTLPEYFDDALLPLAGERGLVVEPGHHFEWIWLLHHADRLGVLPRGEESGRLHSFAHERGIDPASGLPYGEVSPDGRILNATSRLWCVTEWLKAEAVTDGADRDARVRRCWSTIQKFLNASRRGLWHDRWDGKKQSFHPGSAPASSLYHIILSIEVLCETAGTHPRPFASDTETL